MKPDSFNEVIGGKRYRTAASTLIASDAYFDGSNWERHGRNTFLYRTKNGGYFKVNQTRWQGERDSLTPLNPDEAETLFEELPEKEMDFEDAFPGVTVVDA